MPRKCKKTIFLQNKPVAILMLAFFAILILAFSSKALAQSDDNMSSNLKALPITTAETLLFTPSAKRTLSNLQLLKGVAEISQNGINWYRSAAEILAIGTAAEPHISKTDHKEYVAPRSSTTYDVEFYVNNTSTIYSGATISDSIYVKNNQVQNSNLSITNVQYCNSDQSICNNIAPTYTEANRKFTYILPDSLVGVHYFLKVTASYGEGLLETDVVENDVEISVNGSQDSASDLNVIVNAFGQENIGGTIYAKGDLNLRSADPTKGVYNAKYIIAAGGGIAPANSSENDWKIKGYEILPGSGSDLDLDGCVPGSACKIMKNNISKLEKVAEANSLDAIKSLSSSFISNNFTSDPSAPPEGKVWWYQDGLNISSSETISGRHTILVDGDVTISGDLTYANSNSMLGVIVRNGNVTISSNVKEVDAVFYIYSDTTHLNLGKFITESDPAGDQDTLVIKGAVIARGFTLLRNYLGIYDINGNLIKQPAEQFQYDVRLLFNPPPGFSANMFGG